MSENTEGPQIITQGRRLFKHGKAIKRLYDLLWGTARDNQKWGCRQIFLLRRLLTFEIRTEIGDLHTSVARFRDQSFQRSGDIASTLGQHTGALDSITTRLNDYADASSSHWTQARTSS